MPEYRQAQRQIPARIYTSGGWIVGTFHLPERRSFPEHINSVKGFLKLTDVLLPGSNKRLSFFALRRTSALLIVPNCDEEDLHISRGVGNEIDRGVSCLLPNGAVTGKLRIHDGVRVSDFLVTRMGYIVLRDCVFAGQSADDAPEPIVIVDAGGLIGVTEAG